MGDVHVPEKPSSLRSPVLGAAIIALVVIGGGAAFAYTGGWLSPGRLTPQKIVAALTPPNVDPSGHRRNHAKGICFTGRFEANGGGAALSKAAVLASGTYPALGRLNLGTPDPNAPDATVRVRGLGLRLTAPSGEEWRMAMIDPPFFPVSTPQAFYDLLKASGDKDPNAMASFAAAHPEIAAFGGWAKSAPYTPSYAENAFNSLNAFIFTDSKGGDHAVRWSFVPTAPVTAISDEELKGRGADSLEKEITDRVAAGPVSWKLMVTVANTGDPTNDPSKPWPEDRQKIDAGTLVIEKIIPEANGPCRDVNFDPTVLPAGVKVSDDPFPAARSAAYAVSFDKRMGESQSYPKETK